jgi:hypothetical protein
MTTCAAKARRSTGYTGAIGTAAVRVAASVPQRQQRGNSMAAATLRCERATLLAFLLVSRSVPSGTSRRAQLFIFHGVHEHSGRYAEVATLPTQTHK